MSYTDTHHHEMEETFEIVNNSVILLHSHIHHFIYISSIVTNPKYLKTYHGSSQTQVLYGTGDTAGRLGGTNCGPQLHHSLIKISRVVWVYNLIRQTPKSQKPITMVHFFEPLKLSPCKFNDFTSNLTMNFLIQMHVIIISVYLCHCTFTIGILSII